MCFDITVFKTATREPALTARARFFYAKRGQALASIREGRHMYTNLRTRWA